MAPVDLYTLPHKALRGAMARAGTALSATDPDRIDADLVLVRAVLADLRSHAAHEDEFIQPLLVRLVPSVAAEVAAQHGELDAELDGLERVLDALAGRGGRDVRPDELVDVHRAYQRMVGRNLLHLDQEETVAMPALWGRASGVSLAALMDRFRAAHPEAGELYRRWPDGLSPAERQRVGVPA